MAKFYGEVGYAEDAVETTTGVWEDQIIEKSYYGDVVRNSRRLVEGEPINSDLTVGNSISIVSDAYANQHFHKIRYVKWDGVRWIVTDVEVQRPRLLLRLGGVYNGPEATAPDGP